MTTSISGAALLRAAMSAALGVLAVFPAASSADGLDHRRFRLPNGLTVVVHEDHKAPIVSLAVWYRVGSADESAGRTGLAHLFEHLMFYGSKHHDAPFLDAMDELGGRNVNGETWFDRTAYYATVPTVALDKALWLESDRMGHLLDPLDQTRLDTQRAIVRNEYRDTMEIPYARTHAHLLRHLFPANHPYHHDAFGVMADLDRATLDDARAWFRDHYGAANATLVLAGDITPEAAREKAMAWFGDLSPGPDLTRRQPWVPPLPAAARGTLHDTVTTRRIVRAWPMPQAGTDVAVRLQLAARILGEGTVSRLHKRLVVNDRVASGVRADATALALAGVFSLTVDVADGVDLATVESALDDELRRFVADGPDDEEMALAQVRENTDFLAGTEQMDAKAHHLASGQALNGDPTAEWSIQERAAEVDAASVRRAAADWLMQPAYTLTVLPAPEGFDAEAEDASDSGLSPAEGEPAATVLATGAFHATPEWAIDRGVAPVVPEGPAAFSFPPVDRSQLRAGATFVSAQRAGSEFVHVRFLFGGGRASDHGRLSGTAQFTMSMLDEATSAKAYRLGATFGTECEADACTVDLRVPREKLQAGLTLMVDAVRHAAFRQDDIDRIRTRFLAAADTGQATPFDLATSLVTRRLFGEDHPYGSAAFAHGTRESLLALDADALRAYRRDYLRPDNLSVVMVGDVAHGDGARLLEEAFASWMPASTPVPPLPVSAVAKEKGDVAYLVDRPGARQAHIAVGSLASPAGGDLDLDLAAQIFANLPGSRLNANLRETRGWSYGAGGGVSRQRGPRSLILHVPVEAAHTGDTVAEIRREMAQLVDGTRPFSEAEVDNVRTGLVRSLAVGLETDKAVMTNLSTSLKLGRRDDFWQTFPAMLDSTDAAKVGGALENLLRTEGRTWVIVGDRGRIEDQLRQQFPGLRLIDAQGRIVE